MKKIDHTRLPNIIKNILVLRHLSVGVEPAEMGPLSNMCTVNQTSVYLKKI